ncbi:MAG: PAS domain S-box protein [Chloroflexi bacterium]|nr:PAS domain S-box protein [Chloroflexota bacterium]
MPRRDLFTSIADLEQRLVGLREAVSVTDREKLEQAYQEIHNSLEEMTVAQEELRAQNDELAALTQAVETQRRRYQELFAFAPDGYLVTDANGLIREANRAASTLLGLPESLLMGAPLASFVLEADRKAFRSLVSTLARTSAGRELEIQVQPRHGEPIVAALTVAPNLGRDGKLLGLRWMVRDITERKRASEALKASEARLSSVIGTAMDGIITLDNDQRIVVFNKAAEKIFRCPPAEAVGQPIERFIPERYRAKHSEQVHRFRQSLEAANTTPGAIVQVTGLRADGEEFPLEGTLSAVFTDGQWACTMILRDITWEKRTADALRQSEERFRLLTENSRDFVYRVRLLPSPAYEYASPSAERITGYAPEEWYADPQMGARIVHPQELPKLSALFQSPATFTAPSLWRCVHKDGHPYWLESQLVPLYDDAGNAVAFQGSARDVTERVQAEQALEAEHQRLQAIVENTHTRLAYLDRDFNFVAVNSAYARSSGHTVEELFGKNHFALFPNDENRAIFEWVRATGQPAEYHDKPFEFADQPERGVTYWDWTLSPVKDNAGRVQGFVLSMTETTERVRTQEHLARQAAALTAAANSIVITDPEGRIAWVNPAFTRTTGFTPQEVIGQNPRVLKSGKHDRQFYANLWDTVLAGKVWHGDMVNKRKDGSLYYEDMTITPVKDSQGEVTQFIAIKQDVTERKRTEADRARLLAESENERARLKALLDASPAAIFVADATGRVVLVNTEGRRLLGAKDNRAEYSLEEYAQLLVRRKPDGAVYRPEDLPLQRAVRSGERAFLEEVHFEAPDGRTGKSLVTATPIYSSDGKITGAIAIAQDMGPLEEAERRRNEFLGMVSHELRTPLTAIKGAAATALSGQTADYAETMQLFRIIDQQADKLRDLVNNLLDLTRIEAGALSINAMPTDLSAVVQEATTAFVRSGASHEVHVRLPDALPRVQADGRRVAQVLANMLNNADKFSPPALPIVLEAESDASYVTVHVRDRGRGIPLDKMPSLFKKFSQLHEDSGRALAGTGLGLAICKGIVEAHGGRIWAESGGEGQGATFSFTLPIAAGPDRPALRRTEGSGLVAPDTARRTGHLGRVSRTSEKTRVLSLDDDPQTLRYIRRTLEEAGYQAIVTADPVQCTKLVQEQEPDLVLLDLMLPGTSGFEVLKQIREFSAVPTIFLTGNDQGDNAVRALKTGADDYITKPFSPTELLARIEVVLRRRLMPHVVEVRPPFTVGDLTINFAERRVLKMGRSVSLSATEYKLLYQLAAHAGQVMTHDQLLDQVWGPEYKGETELLRSMMRNLRRSLGDDARQPRYILTEPQVGYRMPKP